MPKICGTEIKGTRMRVAIGFVTLSCLDQKIEFQGSALRVGKWRRSGRSVGLPNFHLRQIARPVSATGQKK